jgi:long-chain acyl-CoA synthetase
VFTVSFYRGGNDQVQAEHLTHENITAGVTAIRKLLPPSASLSAADTIVSAHPLRTALGRTVAYTALYEGTSFATLEGSKLFETNGMTLIVFSFLVLIYDVAVVSSPAIVDVESKQQLGLPPMTVFFLKSAKQ